MTCIFLFRPLLCLQIKHSKAQIGQKLCYNVPITAEGLTIIIFTDLDGTLLNHNNYSFTEAQNAIERVKELKIPLIFTTSKTKAEVEILQKEVGIDEPFIVENGASLFIPKGYQGFELNDLDNYQEYKELLFGEKYKNIIEIYRRYRKSFKMLGFSDMSLDDVAQYTGLSVDKARLAKERLFTEPFLLEDSTKLKQLQGALKEHGLKVTKGGRFYHIMGERQDKGVAVSNTIALFEKLYGKKIYSIALGDSENDLEMLASVDKAIIIQKPDGTYLESNLKNCVKSTYPGAKGWGEKVLECLI